MMSSQKMMLLVALCLCVDDKQDICQKWNPLKGDGPRTYSSSGCSVLFPLPFPVLVIKVFLSRTFNKSAQFNTYSDLFGFPRPVNPHRGSTIDYKTGLEEGSHIYVRGAVAISTQIRTIIYFYWPINCEHRWEGGRRSILHWSAITQWEIINTGKWTGRRILFPPVPHFSLSHALLTRI